MDQDERTGLTPLTVKERDAWWTVTVVDPIAAVLLRLAWKARWVTPNRLTLASLVVAIFAGFSFAATELVLGACLFQLSFLLDCMDGKLAHGRGPNPFGAWLDAVVDAGRMVACYAGLVWAIADDGELGRASTMMAAVYPIINYAVIVTGRAWPRRSSGGALMLEASPMAFLRAVPRRLGTPASPVDAEAVVFTFGPLLGVPVVGIWIGAVINGVHLLGALSVRGLHALSASTGRARAASAADSDAATTSLSETSDD